MQRHPIFWVASHALRAVWRAILVLLHTKPSVLVVLVPVMRVLPAPVVLRSVWCKLQTADAADGPWFCPINVADVEPFRLCYPVNKNADLLFGFPLCFRPVRIRFRSLLLPIRGYAFVFRHFTP